MTSDRSGSVDSEPSRGSPYYLDERAECDGCDDPERLAVTKSGRYCWECIPDEDLAFLLRDLYRGE